MLMKVAYILKNVIICLIFYYKWITKKVCCYCCCYCLSFQYKWLRQSEFVAVAAVTAGVVSAVPEVL